MSGQMMAILLPIIALILVGFFATVWLKDRNRSQEESHDTARLDTDKSSGPDTPRRRDGDGDGNV